MPSIVKKSFSKLNSSVTGDWPIIILIASDVLIASSGIGKLAAFS